MSDGLRGRAIGPHLERVRDAQLLAVLDTVTDDEVAEHGDDFASLGTHHDEHRRELEGS